MCRTSPHTQASGRCNHGKSSGCGCRCGRFHSTLRKHNFSAPALSVKCNAFVSDSDPLCLELAPGGVRLHVVTLFVKVSNKSINILCSKCAASVWVARHAVIAITACWVTRNAVIAITAFFGGQKRRDCHHGVLGWAARNAVIAITAFWVTRTAVIAITAFLGGQKRRDCNHGVFGWVARNAVIAITAFWGG